MGRDEGLLNAPGHHHLAGGNLDSEVVAGRVLGWENILRASHTPACDIDHNPRACGLYHPVAVLPDNLEIPHEEWTESASVPGADSDLILPDRGVQEAETHPGQHPSQVALYKLVITEFGKFPAAFTGLCIRFTEAPPAAPTL